MNKAGSPGFVSQYQSNLTAAYNLAVIYEAQGDMEEALDSLIPEDQPLVLLNRSPLIVSAPW